MDKIKTATKKEFECSSVTAIRNPDQAFLRICGRSLAEVASVFGNSFSVTEFILDTMLLSTTDMENQSVRVGYADRIFIGLKTIKNTIDPEKKNRHNNILMHINGLTLKTAKGGSSVAPTVTVNAGYFNAKNYSNMPTTSIKIYDGLFAAGSGVILYGR